MNLADYLSELLGQYGEVSMPGLGYFVRQRISAYYNDAEGRFYPPYHQVKFLPETRDDDIFVQYVAERKNISLASSKYFTEKYVARLKDEASKGKYLFSGLGAFIFEQDQLVFKPNDKIAGDPVFYGLPAVNINKSGLPLRAEQLKPKPVFADKPVAVVPVSSTPVTTTSLQPYVEEEPVRRRRVNIWFLLLVVLTAIALSVLIIFQFFPATFNKLSGKYYQIINKKPVPAAPVKRHIVKPDTTVKQPNPVIDTAAKKTTTEKAAPTPATNQPVASIPPVDSADFKSHYEVIIGAFSTQQVAETALKIYKDKGINARILNLSDAPGRLLRISAGSYPTRQQAEAARMKLVNSGDINPNTYSIEIKPRQ